jgi:iron complex transport system substrate-binding protein
MKKYIYNILTLTAIVCLTLIFACTPTPTPPPTPPPPPPPPTQEKPPQQAAPQEELPTFPITVTDDLGRKVTISKLPQRIVSLAPSVTEMLFALGLDDRIVGTTDYCDYPEAAKSKTRVSGYSTPDLEKIVAVQPDLILAESIHENTVLPALEKLGLPVFVTFATSIDVILHDITVIGQVTGKSKAAQKLASDMTKQINAVTSKTSALAAKDRPGVLYVVWFNPIWTMGAKTFTDDLIAKAGGTNVFSADFEKARVVSLEAVVTKNPQVILVSAMATTYNNIKKETRLATVDAIKNNRVYKITDSNLIERPGPRIVQGLEEVAKLIHPEIFGTRDSK